MSDTKEGATSTWTKWAGNLIDEPLPANGIIRAANAEGTLWEITIYQLGCGHWVQLHPAEGPYSDRDAALRGLIAARQNRCWTCLDTYLKNLKSNLDK